MAEQTLAELAATSTLAQRELAVMEDQLDAALWELEVLRRSRDALEQRLLDVGRAARRAAAAGDAWLPSSQHQPMPETDVLAVVVTGPAVRITVAARFQSWRDGPLCWYSQERPAEALHVTHWQPLPRLPGR